ncbi:MAG: SprT family zinc-dependent metalloprotease [Minwuia sp.]|nr:SprT family zinc-dependent metalloprotease [Minwuia sp.]
MNDFSADLGPLGLKIVRNARSRRLRLRLDRREGYPVLTLPRGVSERTGLAFVQENLAWIRERQAARPTPIPFAPGTTIPVGDHDLLITRSADRRGTTRQVGDTLLVGGEIAHINRRVSDWLRAEARRQLTSRAHHHADRIGARIARVRVADQQSRWGSCSGRGVLSFNWRLILAPSYVLDYVAAHEVAHLQEMNHGPRFHAVLATLLEDPRRGDQWLTRHGPELRRYGVTGAASPSS